MHTSQYDWDPLVPGPLSLLLPSWPPGWQAAGCVRQAGLAGGRGSSQAAGLLCHGRNRLEGEGRWTQGGGSVGGGGVGWVGVGWGGWGSGGQGRLGGCLPRPMHSAFTLQAAYILHQKQPQLALLCDEPAKLTPGPVVFVATASCSGCVRLANIVLWVARPWAMQPPPLRPHSPPCCHTYCLIALAVTPLPL
jgi:hypothetical protein